MITNSNVTINYPNHKTYTLETYVMFCILAGTCGALLYWYINASAPPINVFDTELQLDEYHVRSHWGDELNKMVKTLISNNHNKPVKLAITGVGGSGKTDLAKQYVHEHKQNISIAWIIEAETPLTLWRSYRNLANKLEINSDRKREEDDQGWHKRIRDEVNEVLSKNPRWVLVFDNVEQLSEELDKYFPTSEGTVLITTRHENLLGDPLHSLGISTGIDGGLNSDEATMLLQQITKLHIDEGAVALAENLERLPLYLRAAGSVILNSDKKWSYATYNNDIQRRSPKEVETEQNRHIKPFNRKEKAQHTVILDSIGQLSTAAQDLLVFCSYIAPTGIPRILLDNFIQVRHGISTTSAVFSKNDELLAEIRRTSLLQRISGKPVYNIHRITQQVLRQSVQHNVGMSDDILKAALLPYKNHNFKDEEYRFSISGDGSISITEALPHLIELTTHQQLLQAANQDLVELLECVSVRLNPSCGFG